MSSVAVMGCGDWGKQLIRNYWELKTLQTLYDVDERRLKEIKSFYPPVKIANNLPEILGDDSIEGIVISIPAESHYEIAKETLLGGKYVFVEKPLSLRVNEGRELMTPSPRMGKDLNGGLCS